jgi:hypothetical protein
VHGILTGQRSHRGKAKDCVQKSFLLGAWVCALHHRARRRVRDVLPGLFLVAPLSTAAFVLLSGGYPSGLKNPVGAGMVEIWTRWRVWGWVAGVRRRAGCGYGGAKPGPEPGGCHPDSCYEGVLCTCQQPHSMSSQIRPPCTHLR